MKLFVTVCCALAAVAAGRTRSVENPELEASANSVVWQPRDLAADPSIFSNLVSPETLGLVLEGVQIIGSQLMQAFVGDGTGESVARALSQTDPIELMLNTIDLDTTPCRRRLACEVRSGLSEYTFGSMVYELAASYVPALQKYGEDTSRELTAPTCAAAYQCRYSDSPLMGTARSMRSVADGVCDMEGESLSSILCRTFVFVVDTLETL